MARSLNELKNFKYRLCKNKTSAEKLFEMALMNTRGIPGEKKKSGRISFKGQKIMIGMTIVPCPCMHALCCMFSAHTAGPHILID